MFSVDPSNHALLEREMSSHSGTVTAAHILSSGEFDVDTAHRLLFKVLAASVDSGYASDRDCEEAIYTLSRICFFGGQPELWEPFEEVIARARPRISDECFLLARLLADPRRENRPCYFAG